MYLVTEPGAVPDADGYDLTADGDKVAFAVAGIGGDVVLLESADNGATWTETVIYDIDESGATEGDEPADGSCSLLYDSNENLHVAWGCYQFIGGAPVPARDAGIRHWSAATGVQEIAFANPDTSIVDPGGRDGNFASGPDITADASGNVVIVYTTFVDDQDIVGNYYEHVFATGSADGGTTWSASTDITPGSGFDGVFPSVSDLADANIHMVYMCDALAGNAIQATHGPVASAFMYLTVPVADLTTGVKEIHGVLPEAYNLEQNYPNPFNPTTNIRYSIPASSDVSLKVYNLVGEEVATLVNGHQDAGHYVADFDATNLANGTYFYTLKAGNFSETKKMLLIK